MVSDIFFENKKYISVKDAANLTGYSKDYIGQLCRSNKILSKRVGRVWYVEEESLLNYKNTPTTFDFSKNLYSKKDEQKDTIPSTVNHKVLVPSPFIAGEVPTIDSFKIEVKKDTEFPTKSLTPKKQFVQKSPFVFDSNFYKKLAPLTLIIIFIISAFSVKNNLSSLTKNNSLDGRSQIASVVSTDSKLNPIDHSGVVVYRKINSWFEGLFSPAPVIINTTSIVKVEPTKKTESVVATNTSQTNINQTKVVNTTKVIERIIEKPVSGFITQADLETRLQELSNKISSEFYSLSTGSGGSVTNIYQQIAQSQRIDKLTNTTINTPTINGGTITNATISGGTLSLDSASLGTTTLTNLTVTNTSTSTFSGGIALTGGCITVNGTCLGTGSGSGGYNLVQDEGSDLTLRTTLNFVGGGVIASDSGSVTTVTINGTSFTGAPNSVVTTDGSGALLATGTQLTVGNILATTTATSTFMGGISTNLLSVTSTIASSTFSNGINLTRGCFSINGNCITSGSGSALTFVYPLVDTANTVTLAFGTTTVNNWSALQTFAFSSTTYGSFTTASTTNLVINGQSFNNLLGTGLTNSGGALTNSGVISASCSGGTTCSGTNPLTISSFSFPYTVNTGYNSTSTTIGFLNGLFSTASSTFSGTLQLPTLSNGGLAVFGGLVSSGATTTAGTGLTYSGNAFNVNTTQNITNLSNLSSNGVVYTANGTGVLNTTATSTLAVGASLSSSGTLGYQLGGTASTLSLNMANANSWTALQTFAFSSTTYGSFTTSSSTVANIGTLNLFSSLNGPLQANAGVVSATTSIGQLYGGTGITSYTAGDILYANSSAVLTKLPIGADNLVLKVISGLPSWQTDLTTGGGGGATAWSTTTNNMIIYPTDTSDIVVLGTNATSTTGNIFEVLGNSLFRGDLRLTGNASTSQLSAYTAYFGGTATSTFDTTGRLTLAYSTSTLYSSFNVASATTANIGTLNLFSSLNGPLHANSGVVSATTSIGVLYGGTGATSFAP
ncbi:MAG: hypothetical protein CEO12_256, partial [Parcubacteria group bacterium Gr01-1014_46]